MDMNKKRPFLVTRMHSTLFVTFDWLEKMKVKKEKDAANCPF